MIKKKKKINNHFLNILFKSKTFYGGTFKSINKNILPFIYGIRNNQIIINLQYINIFIKRIFKLIKLNLKKKKKILIISNSNDSNFFIKKKNFNKNSSIIFFNKKWINGNITNKKLNFFIKKKEINLIIIYKNTTTFLNKELFSLKIPIISLIDINENINKINYPLITNLRNIKSLYSFIYILKNLI